MEAASGSRIECFAEAGLILAVTAATGARNVEVMVVTMDTTDQDQAQAIQHRQCHRHRVLLVPAVKRAVVPVPAVKRTVAPAAKRTVAPAAKRTAPREREDITVEKVDIPAPREREEKEAGRHLSPPFLQAHPSHQKEKVEARVSNLAWIAQTTKHFAMP